MPTIYNPSTSPAMTVTVNAPTITDPTVLSLAMSATSVVPGGTLTATATLTATESVATPIAGASITLTVTPAIGSTTVLTATTDTNGKAVFDVSSLVAAATATSEGFGAWKFVAAFAGMTV